MPGRAFKQLLDEAKPLKSSGYKIKKASTVKKCRMWEFL